MESRHAINGGKLTKFSEQQLVDCDTTCFGCGGGMQSRAFKYYEKNDAIRAADYPYTGRDGSCKASSHKGTGVYSKGSKNVARNDPNAMKTALQSGPITVSIQAD